MISPHKARPRLSVRCPCGTSTSVPAGRVVDCNCGRRWDTGQLPADELAGVSRLVRRSRRRRLIFLANLLLVVGVLVLLGRSAPLPVTVAAFAFVWWRFCRPEWRRRKEAQRTVALPSWRLRSSGTRPGR